MPKTRGRKRYTRNMRSTWKKRRPCVRKTQRKRGNKKRSMRMRGGVSRDRNVTTSGEMDGMAVTPSAVVTLDGGVSMDVEAAKAHAEYIDFQGLEQL